MMSVRTNSQSAGAELHDLSNVEVDRLLGYNAYCWYDVSIHGEKSGALQRSEGASGPSKNLSCSHSVPPFLQLHASHGNDNGPE